MREPWKIPYDLSDSIHLSCSSVDPIALPRRIRLRARAVSFQPAARGGKRARGRISS